MKPMTKANLDANDPEVNHSLLLLGLRNLHEGFDWDYTTRSRCVMALAYYLGITARERADDLADAIGADRDDVYSICYHADRADQTQRDVTAEQIARRFERLP